MDSPPQTPSQSNAARRAAEFKTRPVRNSQEERRAAALAEQKKRRAERIESSRNIDLFAGLSINSPKRGSADLPEEDGDEEDVVIPNQGLARFASMLPPAAPISPELQLPVAFGSTSTGHKPRKGKRRGKNHRKSKGGKASNEDAMETEQASHPFLANAIMFAELLEMNADLLSWHNLPVGGEVDDGIPPDLETGWVALAPIPKGKRCMAVSYQAIYEGRAEPSSRTQLHSRVKGKPFLTFPSPLPPDSILDCILDDNWDQNGILHVVDILRWRGSDFTDCETEFRFWWRDAKLSELAKMPIPQPPKDPSPTEGAEKAESMSKPKHLFPYPVSFIAVPYFSAPLTIPAFLQNLIPLARNPRHIAVEVPVPRPPPNPPKRQRARHKAKKGADMEVDASEDGGSPMTNTETLDEFGRSSPATMALHLQQETHASPPVAKSRKETASLASDGLLLYVSQASYQPGETPLASWVPADHMPALNKSAATAIAGQSSTVEQRSPLDIFEGLLRRRAVAASSAVNGGAIPSVPM